MNDVNELPEWLKTDEKQVREMDRDTFISKSILSLFHILSSIKRQDRTYKQEMARNFNIQVLGTLLMILLVSLSRGMTFLWFLFVYLLIILASIDTEGLVRVVKSSFGVTLFTILVMLPALFMGHGYSFLLITFKVFINITMIGMVSQRMHWTDFTSALKKVHIPDLFILVLDITLKYIFLLGEFSLQMFYALKLRSVGKNPKKYASMGGVVGTIFLQSKEMAEDMYQAMECRGFSGKYMVSQKISLNRRDYFFLAQIFVFIAIFIYLERMIP